MNTSLFDCLSLFVKKQLFASSCGSDNLVLDTIALRDQANCVCENFLPNKINFKIKSIYLRKLPSKRLTVFEICFVCKQEYCRFSGGDYDTV